MRGTCARDASGRAAAAPPSRRDELAPSQVIELHWVPQQAGPTCSITNWRGSRERVRQSSATGQPVALHIRRPLWVISLGGGRGRRSKHFRYSPKS